MVEMDHMENHVLDHSEIILLALIFKNNKIIFILKKNKTILLVFFLDIKLVFDYKIYKQNLPFVAYFP